MLVQYYGKLVILILFINQYIFCVYYRVCGALVLGQGPLLVEMTNLIIRPKSAMLRG